MRHTRNVLLAGALAITPMADAFAQEYPTRRVTVIAPFPPGAQADAAARIVMKKMSELLGQPFVIENRQGALGQIGIQTLLGASPDGYTICWCNDGSVVTVPAAYLSAGRTPPYLPKDLTAVGQGVETFFIFIANKDLGLNNFRDVVEYVREHPGKLRIASASPMATIVTGLLKQLLGSEAFIEVPYKSGGEPRAIVDMLGGSVDVMASTSITAVPQIEAGAVRAIGTVGWERNPFLPAIPTLEEQTPELTDFHRSVSQLRPWNGILGPKNMPKEVVDKLSAALAQALNDPEVVLALQRAKVGVQFSTPGAFEQLLERLPIVTNVMRQSGAKFID